MSNDRVFRCVGCGGERKDSPDNAYYCEKLRGYVCKRCARKLETEGFQDDLDLSDMFGCGDNEGGKPMP